MSSTASAAARDAGFKFKFVSSWTRALHFIQENSVKFLIADLVTEGFDLQEFSDGLASLAPDARPTAIVYAPHVEGALLQSAQACGFDFVLTRGQAHRGLAEIMKS